MASAVTTSGVALAAGVASHVLYFHRYECHMHAMTYLNTFLVAYVGGAVALVKLYGWTVAASIARANMTAGSFLLGVYGSLLIYRTFLNPLNKFPGPYWARFSNLWLSTQLAAKSNGYYVLQDLHKKYGSIVRIGSHDLSITDPNIMEVSYGNKSKVTKGDWYDGDVPLTSMHTSRDKGLHDRRRRVWAPAFAPKALREYETEIGKFTEVLVGQIGRREGEPVNMSKWFNLFSFDAMGRLAFGRDYGMLQAGEMHESLALLSEGMQPLALRLPTWLFRFLLNIPGLSAGYSKFVQFCVDELTWRVRDPEAKNAGGDIMSWLLQAYEDVQRPEKDPLLQADARLVIVAGSDTTAATMTFLFYHLAKDPDQVRKLREELQPLTQGNWGDSEIRNAQHLNGCINEALRLHPPVPSGVSRLTPPEGLRVGDTWIPGRTTFFTPMYAMGRDENIYTDADTFLPERWYAEEDKVKHRDAFAPFSAGPMGCIGKNLALMELRTVTARFVLTYDMKLAPGEDGDRLLHKTKDHFTVDLGDLDIVFKSRDI